MTKIRITPFLVLNPIIAAWATYSLVVIQMRGGFVVIMTGFLLTVIAGSIILLVLDRLLHRQIEMRVVWVVEILTLLLCYKLADWYLYG